MASTVLKNAKIYVAGFDLSGKLNACAFEVGADMLDDTHFGDGTRKNAPGLATVRVSHQGHWDANGADGVDDVLFSRLGTADVPATVIGQTGAVGDYAYFFRSVQSEYQIGGQVGDLVTFSVAAEGADGAPPIRGKVLHAAGSVVGDANGTGVVLGAASSGQTIYGALHVLSGSGGTLDVTVESDVNSSFGSPVTKLTFAQQTGVGSDWQSVAGPNTDTDYRVVVNVGGGSPDFSFVVVVGIA